MQSAIPSPVIRNTSFPLKIEIQFFLLLLLFSWESASKMKIRMQTMSGMTMRKAQAKNESQLSNGPTCRNGSKNSTRMIYAMRTPPSLDRFLYKKGLHRSLEQRSS